MLDSRDRTHRALVHLIAHECTPAPPPPPPFDLPLPRRVRLRQVAERLAGRSWYRLSHAVIAPLRHRHPHAGAGIHRGNRIVAGQWRRNARFMDAFRQPGAGAAVKHAAPEAGSRTPSAFVAAFRASFRTTPGSYFRQTSKDHEVWS